MTDMVSGLDGHRRAAAVACVISTIVLVVLDAAIANVALPTIAQSLDVTPAVSVRTITAYQMALVMALLPAAALGESVGYRRVYAAGVALFTAASALCAFAPTLDWLVAARFLQGLGGAAVMSLGIALLRNTVPHRLLGSAIGWNALAVALSSAAGPTIGAFILSVASWPWLFAVNIPLGILVLFATRALPYTPGSARRLDIVSVMLNAAGFAALVIGSELLPVRPLAGTAVFAVAAVSLAALVRREMPQPAPLIPLDLLRSPSFRVSVVASVCCFTAQTAAMVALPFYLQHGLGLNTMMTGLFITPWPLTVAVVAPLSGRLSNTVSSAWLCAAGGACFAAGLAAAALLPLHGAPWPLVPCVMLCGLGFGLFQVPNNRNMLLSAPRERSGAAGGMQGTARLSGQTAGAVLMTLLFTLIPLGVAPRAGLGIAALLALTGGFVSTLRVERGKAGIAAAE